MAYPSEEFRLKVINLPELPGIYQYFDKSGKIIYIGKAKKIRKRVSSYFTKIHDSFKTQMLVKKIVSMDYMVVDSEQDALLLENNLIKKYQPRYNILLKDGKSFPWICVKNESFPRVFSTRNIIKDGSKYFGPYTNVKMMNSLLELIRQLYPLRTCRLDLRESIIQENKYRPCLEYHIGKCNAPCIAKESVEQYEVYIDNIQKLLKGNINLVIQYLKNLMQSYADDYQFEKAHHVKVKLALLENYQSKSTIVSPSVHDVDVFSFLDKNNDVFVNYLKVVNGQIIQAHTVEIKRKLDESKEEILVYAILNIRERLASQSNEIIVPFEIDFPFTHIKIMVPKIGDKKKLLELSERNLLYYANDKLKQRELVDPERHTKRILNRLKDDLHLNELPVHIECFDNSNIQGTNPVAACVVFKNARPAKREYRHFNVKTVIGANDFASMEEIIYRRYKRLLDEKKSLPQLIIIDGGKGQLGAALQSLEKLELRGKIAIIGIAKKLEEIYFPGDSLPLYLDKNSESLKVIQFARNEAHRFGITFHRQKRSDSMIQSILNTIPGVGEKTAEKLLLDFGSIDEIKKLDMNALSNSIGLAKAKIVYRFFQ
jgi:excinuclease ABC subunit C